MASIPLRCELVAKKNRLAWKWTVAVNWMREKYGDIAEVSTGRDFVAYLTTLGALLHCGEIPRRISYEKFRVRPRRRAHAAGTALKRLSKREREVYDGHSCDSTCSPVELPMMLKIRVQQVACGVTHCVVLGEVGTEDGVKTRIFSWGLGEYGQLGLGDCQFASELTPVIVTNELEAHLQSSDDDHRIILRCGAFSTYIFSRGTSILWHWGLLPSADHESHFVRQGVPVQFPLLDENFRLRDVDAGVEHIVILTEDRCVYTWGYGSSGQLGLGPSITSLQHPTKVDFFHQEAGHRIVAVSCGWNHSVAVSRDGQVFAWGNNAFGECGAKSKFCEYFHPVLVAIPTPEELGLASFGSHAQIRCGGNSSALLIGRVNDTYFTSKRAFTWGVTFPGVGIVLPMEVFSWGGKGNGFADCFMGLKSMMWLLQTTAISSPPSWIFEEVGSYAKSSQGFENGLACLRLMVGSNIWIRVQAISKAATDAIALLDDNEGVMANNLLELTLEQGELVPNSIDKVCACVSISSVKTQRDEVAVHPTVEITLLAQVTGKVIVSLTSSIGEIVGNKFVVDVLPRNNGIAESINAANNSISLLGVRIEGTETEMQERLDRNWYRLHSNRIRVHTNDTVIALISSTANNLDPAVQVEFHDNHWQYGLTHLDVVGDDGKQYLGVVTFQFASSGYYFIYDAKPPDNELDRRIPLLVVSCCMNTQERKRVLTENHDLVLSKYRSALIEAPSPAQFSLFLSSMLQCATLKEFIVSSPWAATYDEECCEPSFDFDRENEAQYVLLHYPDRPFVLWDPYFTSLPTLNSLQQHTENPGWKNLSAILPAWAKAQSSKVSFRIATWLEKPIAKSNEKIEDSPIDYDKVCLKGAGLSVQQFPFDFLGNESLMHHRAVRYALAPVNPDIVGVHDSIVSWRRTNGDLFYSVQSNDLLVRRYGHESHEFPETAQSGRITQLKSQLSDFLWQAADGKKLEDLFFLLASPPRQVLQVVKGSSYANVHKVINLRQLVSHAADLGFDDVVAVVKQEWFAIFRGIQALSPPNSEGITFSAFRTFLIDPFHQFFWRQYVHRIRDQANPNRELITRALVGSFETSECAISEMACNNDAEMCENSGEDDTLMVSWSDFIEKLRNFHTILGFEPLPPSDCCRFLYRFDTRGNGQISPQNFQKSLLHALNEIDASSKRYDFTKANQSAETNGRHLLKVAIAKGHRRPNVEQFTSSDAVHKLFAARAKTCKSSSSTKTSANHDAAGLRASANTHLARIRNLPLSHLLREGIYFRPPRKSLYRCDDLQDSTQAQTMGAEDSY